jgi:transposase
LSAGWVARVKKVRKRSEYSGRKYERYKNGYWKRYRRQRKQRFQRVISNLKSRLRERPDPYHVRQPGTRGRPPMPPKAVLVSMMVKVLLDLSYMDAESFLRWASNDGLLVVVPASSTVQEHAVDVPEEYLQDMLMEVASALRGNGLTIILDATGLSTEQYGCWKAVRFGKKVVKRKFVKIHLSVDLKSKTILAGLGSKGWKGDNRFGLRLLDLVKRAIRRHGVKVERGVGDGGYQSREMASKVEEIGGIPFIKAKCNVRILAKGHPEWKRMILRQRNDPEGFKAVYCYRVVIEGIISALKRMFGHKIASKKRHNQDLEILCRLVLWNYGRVSMT